MQPPPLFDAQLQASGLTDLDLADLRFFGVEAALCVTGDDLPTERAQDVIRALETRLREDVARLRKAEILPFVALGIHPRCIPARGLDEVLARLPALLGAPRVVAVGAIGLERGGPVEEQTFLRQLELAENLRRQVIVHTPSRDKARITRRSLALLRESGVAPDRVLVGRLDAQTARLVREFGYHGALMVHPARMSAEQAVRVVRQLGSGELILASDAGSGPGDLVALARTVMLLEKAGLSKEIIQRVSRDNARKFFGIEEPAPPA